MPERSYTSIPVPKNFVPLLAKIAGGLLMLAIAALVNHELRLQEMQKELAPRRWVEERFPPKWLKEDLQEIRESQRRRRAVLTDIQVRLAKIEKQTK